jgi:hypothetical protein
MNEEKMPKRIENGTNKERGRLRNIKTDKITQDLKATGIRNLHAVARDQKEGSKDFIRSQGA